MQKIVDNLKTASANFIEAFFISTAIVALIFWLVGQPLEITGDSMYPTYQDGEKIIAEKISYKLGVPERGDEVIIKHPDNKTSIAIKRVVGMPFDKFLIKNGLVYINGQQLDEPYLNNVITEGNKKIKANTEIFIPENKYVLLGDNRKDSIDSRYWGFIDEEDILGKVVLVYLPFGSFRTVQ